MGEEYGLRLESGGTYFFEVNIDPANKITDLSGYEMEPTPVVLDEFPIVFAQIGMTSTDFRLMDEHRPEAIDKENENNQEMNIGVYKVDMKFRLRPEDPHFSPGPWRSPPPTYPRSLPRFPGPRRFPGRSP